MLDTTARWVKNVSGAAKVYGGQTVADNAYYQLQSGENKRFFRDDSFMADLGIGDAKMATDNTGNTDIASVSDAIAFLIGSDIANTDGRVIVHATPRKRGTFTCFTGSGDDQADNSKVAGANGTDMTMTHTSGGGAISPIYIDFNTIANETLCHAGWIMWKDALNDLFWLETVPKLSTYTASTGTNYNLYGGYLIIPAAGNGTISPTTMALVEVPFNEYGVRSGAGYWNATYNTSTKVFDNITAAPYGNGQFNMFTVEIVMDRFVNRFPMLGSGCMGLDTYDASQLGHGMRLKLSFETRGTDHTWYWCGGLKIYRKKTV